MLLQRLCSSSRDGVDKRGSRKRSASLCKAKEPNPRILSGMRLWRLTTEQDSGWFGCSEPIPPLPPPRLGDHLPGGRGAEAKRASFSRRKATQPGTCTSLSPWSKSGPLNP